MQITHPARLWSQITLINGGKANTPGVNVNSRLMYLSVLIFNLNELRGGGRKHGMGTATCDLPQGRQQTENTTNPSGALSLGGKKNPMGGCVLDIDE